MLYINNCFCSPNFLICFWWWESFLKHSVLLKLSYPPTVHPDIPSHFSSHRQFTYVFASKAHVDGNRRMNEKGLLTQVTIYFFLNWNLATGAASTAQQNQPVIMEKEMKAHAEQKIKSLFLSVICRCTHSSESLNSTQTKTSNAAALLKQKATSACCNYQSHLLGPQHSSQGVQQAIWKAKSSTALFSGTAEHLSSPVTLLVSLDLRGHQCCTYVDFTILTQTWIQVLTLHELQTVLPCLPY